MAQSLSGHVQDDKGTPLRGVKIAVPALRRAVGSDSAGNFRMANVPRGTYAVEFSTIGYRDETRTVEISDGGATLAVTMRISPFQIPSLTITATAEPTSLEGSSLATAVVEGRDLEQTRGQALEAVLDNTPGVTGFSRGPGAAKPVIRGMMGDRVLVLSDGVRQEGQVWDEEQSPEIDAFDLERVEIVRGPASVLYGAGALGGVVNVIRPDVPSVERGADVLSGVAQANVFSNNGQIAGALTLSGATNDLGYRAHATYRNANDYNTPNGFVTNTGETEFNASATAGIDRAWGSLMLDVTHVARDQNIKVDPEGPESDATPFQKIGHDRARVHGSFPISTLRLEADASVQMNARQEFETRVEGDPDAAQAAVDLTLTTLTVDARAHHSLFASSTGTAGVTVAGQTNTTAGIKPLIPGYDQTTLAGFVLENFRLGAVTVSVGGRYDARTLNVNAVNDSTMHVSSQSHSYGAVSGTAGLVWHIGGPFSFAANAGTAWRAPSAAELFIHGPDEGVVRYKIGDSSLVPENAFNVDASVRIVEDIFQAEFALFRNHVAHYIYLAPTGAKDAATGFDEYKQTQNDATLMGMEAAMQVECLSWLLANAGVDLVRGTLDGSGSPVPLMPATREKIGLRFVRPELWGARNPYLAVTLRHTEAQTRIGMFESETPEYTLVTIGLGAEVPVSGTVAHIDLTCENVANRAYFDHLSRYKEYALDPGRNFALRVRVPFIVAP